MWDICGWLTQPGLTNLALQVEPSFADEGDSGAAVFNQEGQALDLFFGGHQVEGTRRQTIAMITPIKGMMDVIMRYSRQGNGDSFDIIKCADCPGLRHGLGGSVGTPWVLYYTLEYR